METHATDTTELGTGVLRFIIKDKATGARLPCRIYFRNHEGKPQRRDPLPFWIDHVTCEGVAEVKPETGAYSYEIASGKEYSMATGTVTIENQMAQTVSVELERIADLASSGWFLIRVLTDVPHTYRFAMTGPFYVEIGDQKNRISKASAKLFLDWVKDANVE